MGKAGRGTPTSSASGRRDIDGREHVSRDNKYPYRDKDGEGVGIMGISRDITDRKQSQRRLEQSRERLRSLYREVPDAVIIHDADGNVLDVNDQTVDDRGYSRAVLLSMNVARIEAGLDAEDLQDIWGSMEGGDRHKVVPVTVHRARLALS